MVLDKLNEFGSETSTATPKTGGEGGGAGSTVAGFGLLVDGKVVAGKSKGVC